MRFPRRRPQKRIILQWLAKSHVGVGAGLWYRKPSSVRTVVNMTMAVPVKSGITPEVDRIPHYRLTELQVDDRRLTFVPDPFSLQILGSVALSALVILLKRLQSSGGRLVLAGLRERRRRVMVVHRAGRCLRPV